MPTVRAHCTFCDLINGAGEVSVCYEDSSAMAFMDIQPVNAGHVLVAPRQHFESLFDVPQELGEHLFHVTMRIAGAVRRVTGSDDMNIVVSSGEAAGQDVFHYHIHIIPRRPGDGFDIDLPFAGSEMPDRTMLDAVAARLITELGDPLRRKAREREVGRVVAQEPPADANQRSLRGYEGAHGELVRDDTDAAA